MPVSNQFLAGLLPLANQQGVGGALAQYGGGSLPGYGQFNVPPPPAAAPLPPPPAPPPAVAPQVAVAPTEGAPPPVPIPDPQAAPATLSQLPGAPPMPHLLQVRGKGVAAHEEDTVGSRQKGLIEGSYVSQAAGVESAAEHLMKGQDEVISALEAQRVQNEVAREAAKEDQRRELQVRQEAQDGINRSVQERTSVERPTDYWADKSVGSRVMMTLALALGGFAAGKSGGPNQAMAMLNADMDRDIKTKELRYRQQSGEANAKVDAAQQAFNNNVRSGGLEYARDVEKASQAAMLANQTGIMAAKSKREDIQARAVETIGNLMAEKQKHEATAMIKFVPKAGGGVSFLDPKTGLPLTQAQAFKIQSEREARGEEFAGKAQLQQIENEGKVAASHATQRVDATTKGTQFISSQMQQAGLPGMRAQVEQAMALQQQVGDKGSGAIAQGLWARSPLAYGQLYGKEAAAREQAFQSLANYNIKQTSGGAVSESEWTRNVAALYGAKTEEARQQAIEAINENMQRAENNIYAGANPESVAQYRANLAAVQKPKIDFKPKAK